MTEKIQQQVKELMGVAADVAASSDFSVYECEEENLELDPVGGRRVLGILNEEERRNFRIMIGVEGMLSDRIEELVTSTNLRAAEKMIENGGNLDMGDIRRIQQGTLSPEAAEELYMLEAIAIKAKGDFWYSVRYRLQTFATYLEIAANYRVVLAGKKY